MKNYSNSAALHERACKSLAGGVSSEFRKYSQPHPLFYSRASGVTIVDADGNEYLDFTLSQGPLILGHSHPRVLQRVTESLSSGQLFAGQHLLELELAEQLQAMIPCAERLRFSLSGSEAAHTALRLSRAITKRPKFLRFEGHYHGWFDNVAQGIGAPNVEACGSREAPELIPWTGGLPPRVQEECVILPWNDLDLVKKTLERRHTEIAALITEPVMCNNGCIQPKPGFLEGLRELCTRYGIVLIFDEVITGFRLSLGGAQRQFGIVPDLGIFGKALASGFPISVIAGKESFMRPLSEGTVIHAGTMNSGQTSVAAALATLEVLKSDNIHERLYSLGRMLMDGLRDAARKTNQPLLVQGPGPMFHVGFSPLKEVSDFRDCLSYDKAKYAAFARGMQERGIRLIGRGLWYISAAHTEADIRRCIDAASDVFSQLR